MHALGKLRDTRASVAVDAGPIPVIRQELAGVVAVVAEAVMRVVEAAVGGAWASAEVTVTESSGRADEVTDAEAGAMSTAEAGATVEAGVIAMSTAEAGARSNGRAATTAGAGAMSTAHAATTAEAAAMAAADTTAATATASGLRIAQHQAASQDGRDQSH
jgi:hypothetical protein